MDGRVYTLEEEIDCLHEDLGRARRYLWDLEQAELQGRVALRDVHRNSLRRANERVRALEVELRDKLREQQAAEEAAGS